MTTTTITRTYASYDQAASIVLALESANIPSRDITLLSHGDHHKGLAPHAITTQEKVDASETFDTAVVSGGIVGGVGLLTSLGLIFIPGLGAVAAAGWLAATLGGFTIGATTGGLIGAITELLDRNGVDKDTAARNANAVNAGSTLVAVRCETSQLNAVESIMGSSDDVLNTPSVATRSVA